MSAPVQPGDIVAGKYRVEGLLGEGGMGVVVAAHDEMLERRVAIKFLLPEYSQNSEAAARFTREARAAVKIKSEHIARVIDVSTMENGSPYMVMEFLEGCDLAQLLLQRGPLPIDEAVSHVVEACDAIAEAHSYGIVHRDLKPANLFLSQQPDGSTKVKVLDFGISKNTVGAADGTDPSLTRTSSMMGSPLYMSPEQMRSTKDVDTRTDIWALGVILYELLIGELPFNASSIPELSAKILLEEPTPITRPDVPESLKNTLYKALSKDPATRFPTIAEFSICLAEFAPRRHRTTLERITRVLAGAGMSSSVLDIPPTVPPSVGAGGTYIGGSAARPHSATAGNWGTATQGPATKKRGAGIWAFSAVAALAILGGGVALVTTGGSQSAAPQELETAPERAPATQPKQLAKPDSPEPEPALPDSPQPVASSGAATGKADTAPPQPVVSASPSVTPAPKALVKPSTPQKARRPKVRKARSKPKASVARKPAPKKRTQKSAASFKSKFGGRK